MEMVNNEPSGGGFGDEQKLEVKNCQMGFDISLLWIDDKSKLSGGAAPAQLVGNTMVIALVVCVTGGAIHFGCS